MINAILTGSAYDLAGDIPDQSISLCLTDPVYWDIEQYEWLGRECARVLVPGGTVLAQVGNYYLIDAANALVKNLEYIWTVAEVYPSVGSRLWERRIIQGWKPYLWFSKG